MKGSHIAPTIILLFGLFVLAVASPTPIGLAAPQAIIEVNSLDDTDDGICATKQGGCTLREAINAANANPGLDTVFFALGGGVPTIRIGASAGATFGLILPAITDPIVINGNTGGAQRVMLDGAVTTGGDGLRLNVAQNVVRGLVISNFAGNGIRITGGGGNEIRDCYIGTDASGTKIAQPNIHGIFMDASPKNLILRNVISGNKLHGIFLRNADGNVLKANTIGLGSDGDTIIPNGLSGVVFVDAPSNFIGTGENLASGNVVSGNDQHGVEIQGAASFNNIVVGNFLGTDSTGTQDRGNRFWGLVLNNAVKTQVGGISLFEPNVISGNDLGGVTILGNQGGGNILKSNLIGTDLRGVDALGNASFGGIDVSDSPNNLIGGTDGRGGNIIAANGGAGITLGGAGATQNIIAGNAIGTNFLRHEGLGNRGAGISIGGSGPSNYASANQIGGKNSRWANTIAFNRGAGVRVFGGSDGSGSQNSIRHNSIYSNRDLGIDLNNDGVTPNDAGTPPDADEGPNHLQNSPRLLGVRQINPTEIEVGVRFNSAPNTIFVFEFFRSTRCDPTYFGEGQVWLARRAGTTDGNGNLEFSAIFPTRPIGEGITATATDPSGNTSEFSRCRVVLGEE